MNYGPLHDATVLPGGVKIKIKHINVPKLFFGIASIQALRDVATPLPIL